MKRISLVILSILLFQTILFGSGLYGVILENDAQMCTCNHSSSREIHQDDEDKVLSVRKSRMVQSHTEHKNVRPTCHSAKKGEPHVCQCKKANKKSEYLQSFLQNTYLKASRQHFAPENRTLFIITDKNNTGNPGFSLNCYHPPEVI